ncbi:MAG: ABC transporter substrate-binding protein, partial [Deltaproteobacteria bacterium]|nr:ABC transporter substrate-binding protein [Deltaproteobacteria bacterium]
MVAIPWQIGDCVKKISYLTARSCLIVLLALALPSESRADKPVMAGVAGPGVSLTYAYLAQDAGLWRKHGLDIRMVLFEAGSTLAQVARTGEVSFAINSGPTTIASRTQGADTVMVAATVNTLPYSLVTSKSIVKWDQLKGKKVGISRFGSGTDTAIRLV